jgi:uncharacterized protein with PIN domain
MKFIVDHNVGKLSRWLRMMGYDTVFFTGEDDWEMVIKALNEDRVVLTKDTGIMRMGVVLSGRLKAIRINSDKPEEQIKQVIDTLKLDAGSGLFTICLECNEVLVKRTPEEVKDRVPPFVFNTQKEFMECPSCNRVFWKGTHWQAMVEKLEEIMSNQEDTG